MRQGAANWWLDVQAAGQPWPFDAAEIRVPIHISHGGSDGLAESIGRGPAHGCMGRITGLAPSHGRSSPCEHGPLLTAAGALPGPAEGRAA